MHMKTIKVSLRPIIRIFLYIFLCSHLQDEKNQLLVSCLWLNLVSAFSNFFYSYLLTLFNKKEKEKNFLCFFILSSMSILCCFFYYHSASKTDKKNNCYHLNVMEKFIGSTNVMGFKTP